MSSRIIQSTEYISVLKGLGYEFKMNDLDDRVEVNGEQITDALESVLFTELRNRGYHNMKAARDAIIAHAYQNRYNPLREYLNGLKYDGGKYIEMLAGYFDNPDLSFETWLRRWCIGAVRKVLEPYQQNRVLVLEGPQRIGKSEFAKWLLPSPLKDQYFKTGPINLEDKDHRILLATQMIWEVAELSRITKKADQAALKDFLTTTKITERPSYGRYRMSKSTVTSFIGTENSSGGLLTDPTGNKRYMVSHIKAIDWKGYTDNLNPDQVWSEAVMLYYAGESADLTQNEVLLADQINEKFVVENTLEGLMMQHYEINPNQTNWWVSSAEVAIELQDVYKGTTDQLLKRLSDLMTYLGCERLKKRPNARSGPVWGYAGVRKL